MKPLRLILGLLLGAGALVATAAGPYDSEARSRKADYYFLEGLRQRALGREDLATAMMGRAAELNSVKTDRDAYEYGSRMMIFGDQMRDSLLFDRGLQLCEGYFAAHPDDAFVGTYLASFYAGSGKLDKAIAVYDTLQALKPTNAAITANHADMLMRARRLDEAIALYRNLEKTMGRGPALTQRITNVMIWQGDTVGALNEIDGLIAAQPRSVEALQLGAAAASQFGRPERALDYIDRAKAIDPTNGTTYYYAANVYRSLGRTDDYEQAIRGAITGDELERDAKVELLRYYIDSEMKSDSVAGKIDPLFESLVGQYTHDYELRMLYMSFLAANRRWLPAAEQMEQAVAIHPEEPADYIMLARLYGSADDLDGVLNATEMGLEHHPQVVDLYLLQAGVFSRKENYDAALTSLRRALSVDSLSTAERADIYRSMADLGQQSELMADSVAAYYELSLKTNPEDDLTMNNYAYWLSTVEGGDLLRAKDLISKAVVFEPGSATYYDTFAWVCFRLGDLENAKRYIDMALLFDKSDRENNPESLNEILGHAADIYQALGQLDKANEYRQRIQHK